MYLFIIAFSILSAILLLYRNLSQTFKYWSNIGIKGPKPYPIVGTYLYIFLTPVPLLELNWFKKYGKIYGVFNGNKPVLSVAEPELIKNILVKDFNIFINRKTYPLEHRIIEKNIGTSTGDDWKRQRSIISPTFSSLKIRKMFPIISNCADDLVKHLEPLAELRKDINLKKVNENYTMDVISAIVFATKINSHKDPNNPFIKNAKKVLEFPILRMLLILILPKILKNLFNIKSIFNETANQFLFDLTLKKINERKSDKNAYKKYNDFIQLLVDAKVNNDELDTNALNIENKKFSTLKDNKYLDDEEIMSNGWVFLLAGYEATAITLSLCIYQLALNSDIQERLYEEIQSEFDSEEEISYEKLDNLQFLDSVICETLRLYPPVLILDRKANTDYELGDTGITLFKGQDIEIPVYAIHHCEEYYPNANKFDPDRFMPQNRYKLIPYTYLPFGSGPRNCIGMRFGLFEAKLGLTQIIRKFRFFPTQKTSVPLKFKTISPILATKEVIVGIEKRY